MRPKTSSVSSTSTSVSSTWSMTSSSSACGQRVILKFWKRINDRVAFTPVSIYQTLALCFQTNLQAADQTTPQTLPHVPLAPQVEGNFQPVSGKASWSQSVRSVCPWTTTITMMRHVAICNLPEPFAHPSLPRHPQMSDPPASISVELAGWGCAVFRSLSVRSPSSPFPEPSRLWQRPNLDVLNQPERPPKIHSQNDHINVYQWCHSKRVFQPLEEPATRRCEDRYSMLQVIRAAKRSFVGTSELRWMDEPSFHLPIRVDS